VSTIEEGLEMVIAPPVSLDAKSLLARVSVGRSVHKYLKDEIVFSQGDVADAVFYVQTGKVRVTVISDLGREAIVAVLGANKFFGEGCLTDQVQRVASVAASMDSIIVRIEKSATVSLIHEGSKFSEMFIGYLLRRSIRVEADLVDQLFNSTEKRLARLLLLSAKFGKQEKPEKVIERISQMRLAEMIGTTRSRVGYLMNKFRRQGFIAYNGGIEIHSTLLNVVLFGDPKVRT
jgi:CRP/FNR family transcriptional regulator, cyclic AMP receptor protein